MSSESDSPTSAVGEPAIIADGISKRYLLGEREQYGALRDVLGGLLTGARRRADDGASGRREEIWAVDDVSFTVGDGEVVGIIGRNGAGKSTLLKILSRITAPTAGEIRMRGRIGSLLEVGSGFHPELTGTENAYLNGAILGMSRTEINAKLPEIIEFAEMGDFMSTPVKHYSVGMFMRLAFAVAAHLDAEILVVDEVLAVGDARFQQKCLAKMGEVARSGRSVLFVSHNLEATLALCDRGLVLDGGRLIHDGPTREAVEVYRRLAGVTTRIGDTIDLADLPRDGTGEARLAEVAISPTGRCAPGASDGADTPDTSIRPGDGLRLEVTVDATAELDVASLGLTIGTEGGLLLLNLDTGDAEPRRPLTLTAGTNRLVLDIPELALAPGRYRVGLRLANPVTTRIGSGAVDLLDPAFVLQIDEGDRHGPDRSTEAGIGGGADGLDGPTVEVEHGAGSVVRGSLRVRAPFPAR
ncbi:MAG: ABC transporter ATP-binding protein [Actinomycetota bacterium]